MFPCYNSSFTKLSVLFAVVLSSAWGVEISTHVHTNCGCKFLPSRQHFGHICTSNSLICSLFHPTAAGVPSNVFAVPAGLTSFTVSWTAPTSGANVTGYRIYWSGGSDQGSVDANATDDAVNISGRSHGLVYGISMVALSDHLPSPVVGPVTVTVCE